MDRLKLKHQTRASGFFIFGPSRQVECRAQALNTGIKIKQQSSTDPSD